MNTFKNIIICLNLNIKKIKVYKILIKWIFGKWFKRKFFCKDKWKNSKHLVINKRLQIKENDTLKDKIKKIEKNHLIFWKIKEILLIRLTKKKEI